MSPATTKPSSIYSAASLNTFMEETIMRMSVSMGETYQIRLRSSACAEGQRCPIQENPASNAAGAIVTPAKAGVQMFRWIEKPGFRRSPE
jgi:hypothetical protein